MYDRILRQLAIAGLAIASLSGCVAHPPRLVTEAAAHLPARAELEHVPFFPQEQYHCGPAALATALTASGAPAAPEELASEIYLPGRRGSLQVELIAATRARDRLAYPLPADPTAVLEQIAAGFPVVIMQNLAIRPLPAWHYAVVVGYDLAANELILRSGVTRRLVVDAARFMRTWERADRWALVILRPDQMPAQPELDRYVAAAASLESVGRLDAAERAYERAREQWPRSVWPVLGLANVNLTRGDPERAEKGYFEALEIDPGNAVAHNNLAELLAARGCMSAARSHIARAATLAKGTALEASVTATARQIEAREAHDADARCAHH